MPWQERALQYGDIVPEISYASLFYPRMLKHLRIYPAFLDERGEKKEITSGVAVDLLNRVRDPGGGKSQILGSYGRLMFYTGEGILFGRDLNSEREKWSFVWNSEVEVEENSDGSLKRIYHVISPTKKIEYEPDEAVCYRMWTPAPRNSYEATSPMRAALEVAEELIILTKSVRSTAVTRLINGLLFMPSEISPPPVEPVGDEDPLNDPWASDFLEKIVTQIETPGTAEAAAPLISWVAGEHIQNIRWVQIHDPQTDYMERDLRKEAVDRLAYGFDMPPEALKGLGSTNHWAAMQILGDMWKSHGASLAEQFCDEIAAAYLQPALRESGEEDWMSIVVDYDAFNVLLKADRSDDAKIAADLGFISPRGFREMTNIPAEYAPTEIEWEQMLEWKSNGSSEQQQPSPAPAPDPSSTGPPPPGPEGDSGRRTRVVTSSAESHEAMGAAMMALARCREMAGIRLWRSQKDCPECFESANGQPHALVAALVGPKTVQELGQDPLRLVKGGTAMFKDLLEYWDYTTTQAQAICELIETFAARTLYDERLPQLPNGFASHLERSRNGNAIES